MPGSQAWPTYSARPDDVARAAERPLERRDLLGRQAVRVLRAGALHVFGSKRQASGRRTIPSVAPSAASHAAVMPRATSARSASLNARLRTRWPSAFGWRDGEIRLRVPGRGDRRAARHAHRGRADGDAVEVRGVALREHHALPSAARAADEVLPVGRAAVVARQDRQGDRIRPFVRGVRVIDAGDRIETELGASRPDDPHPLSRRRSLAGGRCRETLPCCGRPPAPPRRRCRRRPDTEIGRSTSVGRRSSKRVSYGLPSAPVCGAAEPRTTQWAGCVAEPAS